MARKKKAPAEKKLTPSESRVAADLLQEWIDSGKPPKADITGMVFVRDAYDRPQADGRRLVMLVGVLAVPKDTDLPAEHQFVVMGSDLPETLRLHIMKDQRVDHTDDPQTRGMRLEQILLLPLWRV